MDTLTHNHTQGWSMGLRNAVKLFWADLQQRRAQARKQERERAEIQRNMQAAELELRRLSPRLRRDLGIGDDGRKLDRKPEKQG